MYDPKRVNCDGRMSCSQATVNGATAVMARGELSLNDATINSCYGEGCNANPGDNVRDIVIEAEGQNAMRGATLNCFSGSTCDLHCYGDSCLAMTNYRCYDGAVCNCDGSGCPQIVTVSMTENINQWMAFHAVAMSKGDGPSMLSLNEMSASMLILIGTMSAVMILMALFYAVRRSEKGEYQPLE